MRCLVLLTLLVAFSAYGAPERNLSASGDSKRVALIIGNNSYQSVSPLARAVNDAKAIAAALDRIGFETKLLTDATRKQMNKAVNEFAENIAGGGIGVLFFAGHGVQIENQNFLLPVDIEEPHRDTDVLDQAVSLQNIQEKLAQVHAKFALMVIDACRDNPLPRKAGRSIGGLRGLSQPSAPNGQMIIFSAGANETALDSLSTDDRDPNGLFTREFLPALTRPGVSISDALKLVRRGVIVKANSVNHDQHPAIYDQSDGDFYLVPATTGSAPGSPPPPEHAGSESASAPMHGPTLVADANTGCKVWTPGQSGKLTWGGQCVNGLAEGFGTIDIVDGERRSVGQATKKAGHSDGPYSVKTYDNGHLVRTFDGTMNATDEARAEFRGKIVHEASDGKIASEEGTFVNGLLVDGGQTYRDGTERRCRFAEAGSTGVCHYKGKDGYTYDGDYRNGHATGYAKIRFSNSNLYEGSVEDGKPSGHGKWTFATGNTYEGDMRSGKRNGKGVFVWKSGCRYAGDFLDDQEHGQGLYTCPNGLRQEGTFAAGVFVGPSAGR